MSDTLMLMYMYTGIALLGFIVLLLWIRRLFNVLKVPLQQSLMEFFADNKQAQLLQMLDMQNK